MAVQHSHSQRFAGVLLFKGDQPFVVQRRRASERGGVHHHGDVARVGGQRNRGAAIDWHRLKEKNVGKKLLAYFGWGEANRNGALRLGGVSPRS